MINSENTEKTIDLSLLKQYADDDQEILDELINAFYHETQNALKELEMSKDLIDSTRWTEAAHKIKGSAGYVGATELKTLSAKAQNMKNSYPAERQDIYNNINNAYLEVKNSLKKSAQ